ncbi:unnamed protein product, partial [Effrenium voratum]
EATVAPFWWFRAQRQLMACAHLLTVLALLNRSLPEHQNFDWLTAGLMLGPGAALACKIALELFTRERSSVLVERWRFLESSVEQLALLSSKQLHLAPHVIYISTPEEDDGQAAPE